MFIFVCNSMAMHYVEGASERETIPWRRYCRMIGLLSCNQLCRTAQWGSVKRKSGSTRLSRRFMRLFLLENGEQRRNR
ncbi:hypothetical protein CUMW_273980 [Citrus unshiu]|uniref:Uncharacterized protein n=1 Tax=Citrus unshiu TaxID=55188 RepID=A0A2H5MX99_CITUN|nr:hypothetical protein CUMW_273980 [Citrus unshiu]